MNTDRHRDCRTYWTAFFAVIESLKLCLNGFFSVASKTVSSRSVPRCSPFRNQIQTGSVKRMHSKVFKVKNCTILRNFPVPTVAL